LIDHLEYRLISKKGEGTFSEVLKAQSIKTGKYVAIKCMKNHFDTIEQVRVFEFNVKGKQFERNLSVKEALTSPSDYQAL
jgi:serine/threonine protein kinase